MATEAEIKELNELADRVSLLLNEGDRIEFTLVREVTFNQNASQQKLLTFSIPSDGAYFATSLNLYPQRRRVALDPLLVSDNVFRPALWSDYSIIGNVSAAIKVATSRNPAFQNQPGPHTTMFSLPYTLAGGGATSSYTSGFYFPLPEFLPRSSALTIEITPGHTEVVNTAVDPGYAFEYQIIGVLSGYKRIHSFK